MIERRRPTTSDNFPTDAELGSQRQIDGRDKYPEEKQPASEATAQALAKRAALLTEIADRDLGNDKTDYTMVHPKYSDMASSGRIDTTEKQLDAALRTRASGLKKAADSMQKEIDDANKKIDSAIAETATTIKEDTNAYSSISRAVQAAGGYLRRLKRSRRSKKSGLKAGTRFKK